MTSTFLILKNDSIESNNDLSIFKTKDNTYRFGIFITNFKNLVNIKLNVMNEDWDKCSKKSHESRKFLKLTQTPNKLVNNTNSKRKSVIIPADYPLNIFVNKICNESILKFI